MLSEVKANRRVGCCRWGLAGSVKAEIGETFSVRLLCIQALHKIHMGPLVVQAALKGCVEKRRALSDVITWTAGYAFYSVLKTSGCIITSKMVTNKLIFISCYSVNTKSVQVEYWVIISSSLAAKLCLCTIGN